MLATVKTIAGILFGLLAGDLRSFAVGKAAESFLKEITKKKWDHLYISSFEKAFNNIRKNYLEKHHVTLSFNPEELKRVLTQDLAIDINDKSILELSDEHFINLIANEIAKNPIVISEEGIIDWADYQQLAYQFVKEAIAQFLSDIQEDEALYKQRLIKELNIEHKKTSAEIQEAIQEITKFLTRIEIQTLQNEVNLEKAFHRLQIDLTKTLEGSRKVFISCHEPGLLMFKNVLENAVRRYGYRIIELSIGDSQQLISETIKNSDVFIGIYSQDKYYSLSEEEFVIARDSFRRCLLLIADKELSTSLHTLPQIKQVRSEPSYSLEEQKYIDKTPPQEEDESKEHYFHRKIEFRERRKELFPKHIREIEEWKVEVSALKAENDRMIDDFRRNAEKQDCFLGVLHESFPSIEFTGDQKQLEILVTAFFDHLHEKTWSGLSVNEIKKRWDLWAKEQILNIHLDNPEIKLLNCPFSPLWKFWETFLTQSWIEEICNAVREMQSATHPLFKRTETRDFVERLQEFPEFIFSQNWNRIHLYLTDEWCTSDLNKQIIDTLNNLIKNEKEIQKEAQKEKMTLEEIPEDPSKQIRVELEVWKKSYDQFVYKNKNTKFSRCFLAMGRSGSGKSHFVSELLKYQGLINGKDLYYCITIGKPDSFNADNRPWPIRFEKLILDQAKLDLKDNPSCLNWRSLEELNDFLCHSDSFQGNSVKLVVIFDDFNEWVRTDSANFLSYLSSFIENHTRLESLVWVMLIESSDYSRVRNFEKFFNRYSIQNSPDDVSINGWLMIDELNERRYSLVDGKYRRDKKKFELLRQIFDVKKLDADELLGDVLEDDAGYAAKLLTIPFLTWIAVDWLSQENSTLFMKLPNLRYIHFVEEFNGNRNQKIEDSNPLSQNGHTLLPQLSNVETYLADKFMDGKIYYSTNVLKENLSKSISNWEDDGDIDKSLKVLTSHRLLRQYDKTNENDLMKVSMHELDSILLWEYKAADKILLKLSINKDHNKRTIDNLMTTEKRLFEQPGVFEFILLLIENEQGVENNFLALAANSLLHFKELRSCVWITARKVSGISQYQLSIWLLENSETLSFDDEEEFSDFLEFLQFSTIPSIGKQETGMAWWLRFKLLSYCFERLAEWQSPAYIVKFFFMPLLRYEKNCENFCQAIANLHGIEDYFQTTDEFIAELEDAPIIIEKPYSKMRWMRIGAWFYKLMKELALNSEISIEQLELWIEKMANSVMQKGNLLSQLRERERLWACVVRNHYQYVVEKIGLPFILSWLENQNWLAWREDIYELGDVEKSILDTLDEYLTLEIGHYWRSPSVQESTRRLLITSLNIYADATNMLQQKTVFYSIQHTVSSPKWEASLWREEVPYPKIDSRLWPILLKLEKNKNRYTRKLFDGKFFLDQKTYFSIE